MYHIFILCFGCGYLLFAKGLTMNTPPVMTPMQRATGQPGMSPIPPMMAQRPFASPYQQQHMGMRMPQMGSSPFPPGTPQGQTPSQMTPQSTHPGMPPPPPPPHPGMSTSPHPVMSPGPTPGSVPNPGLPASPHALMNPQTVGQGMISPLPV